MSGPRYWYPVQLAKKLRRKPTRVVILGVGYVIYRASGGQPVAHLDRCPHRNVPLSAGACRPDDTIECPYHGWRFSPNGRCRKIPGATFEPKPQHRVATYPCLEHFGIVWLCPHQEGPVQQMWQVPELGDSNYSHLTRQVTFPAGLHAVVENALDVPHTSILHRGLFRSGKRHRIDVVLRRTSRAAEAEYLGEPPPQGLVAQLLLLFERRKSRREGLVVRHWDRFLGPNLLQVEYRLGQHVRFVIFGFCCPLSSSKTELFAIAVVKTPLPAFLQKLLLHVVKPFALGVFRQDVRILALQTANVAEAGGERFQSTPLDVLGSAIARIVREADERQKNHSGPPQSAPQAPGAEHPDEPLRERKQSEMEA